MQIESLLPKDSWFLRWMKLWPTAESPKSFILFSAMSVFGACVGRKVWIDQDVHQLFPMLSVLLIGPSGTGKSTSAGLAFNHLLSNLSEEERPQIISGAPTPEKLYTDLKEKPHAILFASELANFFGKQKYAEGLIPAITEILDQRNTLERRTKTEGLVVIKDPAVTVLGCSTVEWLQEQLPDSATSGGFLPRFLITKEDHKAQMVALPGRALTVRQRIELSAERALAIEEFKALVKQAKGPIGFSSYAVDDTYGQWYNAHKPLAGHLAPFAARAGEFVLRLALLIALSRDRLLVGEQDIKTGIKLYEWCERRLQEVVVPMTAKGRLLSKLLEIVGLEVVSDMYIKRAMRNFCSAQDVDSLINSLIQDGGLRRNAEGKLYRSREG